MTQPVDRDNKTGLYRHPITGEKFPSYSSIADMLAKPALKFWAANQVAQSAVYDRGEIENVTAKLICEQWDKGEAPDPLSARYHALRGAPWRLRDEKADLGTAVHAAIERYRRDGEEWPVFPDDVALFMRSFERFLEDHKPHIIANEITVYNRTIGYAGTLDILGTLPGQHDGLAIIDVKTGKGVYEDAAIQQNAYANGEVYFDTWEKKDIDMPKVEAAYILHVRPQSYKLIPVTLSQANFDVFVALREVWAWSQVAKKTALGKAIK